MCKDYGPKKLVHANHQEVMNIDEPRFGPEKNRNHQDNHQNPAEVGQMDLEAADPTLGDLALGSLPLGKNHRQMSEFRLEY